MDASASARIPPKKLAPVERVFPVHSVSTIHDSGISNNENSNPNIISTPSTGRDYPKSSAFREPGMLYLMIKNYKPLAVYYISVINAGECISEMLVFTLSAIVYGQPENITSVEDFELKAMNLYELTKEGFSRSIHILSHRGQSICCYPVLTKLPVSTPSDLQYNKPGSVGRASGCKELASLNLFAIITQRLDEEGNVCSSSDSPLIYLYGAKDST
ncbi:hypothetical protein ACET3Z_008582 [Daucus carota]